jgi:hypothetical protein
MIHDTGIKSEFSSFVEIQFQILRPVDYPALAAFLNYFDLPNNLGIIIRILRLLRI